MREATKRARAAQQALDHVRDALDALRKLPASSPELVLQHHDALEAHERRGILHFTLAPFRSGTKILLFSLKDDGGTEQGGQNECTVSLALVVLPVNDRPHFMLPSTLVVVEDAGLLTIRRFAQALSAGGVTDDEAWQTLSFDVEVLERSGSELLPGNLFATRPCIQAPQCTSQHVGYCATSRWLNSHLHFEPSLAAVHLTGTEEDSACGGVPAQIDRHGTLRMRTARDQHGTARLKVTVRDDGGRAVGGIDTYGPIEMSLQVLHQPRVFAVIPRFGPISGGNLVTLQGQSFGIREAPPSEQANPNTPTSTKQHVRRRVSLGDVECLSAVLVSDSEIVCKAPAGIGGGAAMVELLDDHATHLPAAPIRAVEDDVQQPDSMQHRVWGVGKTFSKLTSPLPPTVDVVRIARFISLSTEDAQVCSSIPILSRINIQLLIRVSHPSLVV